MTSHMTTLERRLRYLRNWELGNVVLIPCVVVLMWRGTGVPVGAWHLRWIGLVFVSYLLLQGGVYWHLKLRVVRRSSLGLPAWFSAVFSLLRRTNPLLMVSAGAYMLLATGPSTEDRAWGLVILTLAYVEHVNYFVRQLMHDTDADVVYLRRYRRLRHAPLRRDLDAARSARTSQSARR